MYRKRVWGGGRICPNGNIILIQKLFTLLRTLTNLNVRILTWTPLKIEKIQIEEIPIQKIIAY